ncbi:MAG TPA: HTTM domain-containing protein, partial [Pirellulales bacterium]|nr:HTTM domain-containing protein [Pirellulales bacterium]
MNLVGRYLVELRRASVAGWNRFWFTPADPATLSLIRILAGAMLFYTHLVWTLNLADFFGPDSWVSAEAAATFHRHPEGTSFVWSYFWLLRSPAALWTAHIAALVVFALLTIGLFSRAASVLAYL